MMEIFKLSNLQNNKNEKNIKIKEDEKTRQLINEIIIAKRELQNALDNFNYADTKELVDLYSHQITVAQSRYDVLIKNARSYNIKFDNYLLQKINNI